VVTGPKRDREGWQAGAHCSSGPYGLYQLPLLYGRQYASVARPTMSSAGRGELRTYA
jgi:hypothetical protein